MKIDELLKQPPYATVAREEFTAAMHEAFAYHYAHSEHYRKFLDAQRFSPKHDYALHAMPYLPIGIFKQVELVTGSMDAIKKRIFSSATSSGTPSTICLDQVTIDRQRMALARILGDFLGPRKKVFIIFDSPETMRSVDGEVSSRGSAIRGMLMFASRVYSVLNDDLTINRDALRTALASVNKGEEICFFGFTWILYQWLTNSKDVDPESQALLDTPVPKSLVHLGGWKKLKDLNIQKKDFNISVARRLGMAPESVIDVYGFTEQLGTVYPDCPSGFKHVSLYSDVIVRNGETLMPAPLGEKGLLQFLTPVPHSYPGISILSDDIGAIQGLDGCLCGRRGTFFLFSKRSEAAELRGCGDTAVF